MRGELVNGSPNKNGSTSLALAEVKKTLQEEGVETHTFRLKAAAAVTVARRCGSATAFFQLNNYLNIQEMFVVSSLYWNDVFALKPEDVPEDKEGLCNMRVIGRNMAYCLRCREAGPQGGRAPAQGRGSGHDQFHEIKETRHAAQTRHHPALRRVCRPDCGGGPGVSRRQGLATRRGGLRLRDRSRPVHHHGRRCAAGGPARLSHRPENARTRGRPLPGAGGIHALREPGPGAVAPPSSPSAATSWPRCIRAARANPRASSSSLPSATAWAARLEGCDGKVGFFGASYPGALAKDRPEAGEKHLRWGKPDEAEGRLDFESAPVAEGMTIAGPLALTLHAATSNTNMEILARFYDLAPDGRAVLISKGAMLGSLSAPDEARSWRDAAGRPVWPWPLLDRDRYLDPARPGVSRWRWSPSSTGCVPATACASF